MPALQPIELWKESGRFETFGDLLMKLTISGGHQMCLGPTHEEVITDLVRDLIRSYKQLPITLYQIQTKFRDEPRPRFGIVRTREFLMKDAYSFDADVAQLNTSYDAMYEAYCRIFDRCGLPYVIVEAESGPIGGDASHEFMVPCSTGEDTVIQCPACGYAANQERAEIGARPPAAAQARRRRRRPYQAVPTPGKRTIREVCDFLKVEESTSAKLLVYLADGKPVAVLLRGDHEANEAKVRRAFGASTLVPADAATIEKATGAPMGFLGPVGIKIPLVIDRAIAAMPTVVVGGNAVDVHLTGVVPGRDFPLDRVHDLRNAEAGDPCPRCGARAGDQARASRSATSSSSAPSTPRRWARPTSTRRGPRSRSSWAATASASTGSWPRPSRPATTPTASSGRCRSRPTRSCSSRSRSRTPAVIEATEALEKALEAAGRRRADRRSRPAARA